MSPEVVVNGVCWVAIGRTRRHKPAVALEKCPKKRAVLGVGEWFVPGGKLEPIDNGDPDAALAREFAEEWPGVKLLSATPLPILEGSAVPPGPRGLFLMRPYLVKIGGVLPAQSGDGVPLAWCALDEALNSPVVQVRMMVAAAALGL